MWDLVIVGSGFGRVRGGGDVIRAGVYAINFELSSDLADTGRPTSPRPGLKLVSQTITRDLARLSFCPADRARSAEDAMADDHA